MTSLVFMLSRECVRSLLSTRIGFTKHVLTLVAHLSLTGAKQLMVLKDYAMYPNMKIAVSTCRYVNDSPDYVGVSSFSPSGNW